MTSCDVEMTPCKAEKSSDMSSERQDPPDKVNIIDHDSVNKSNLRRSTSLERNTSVEPPVNNSLQPDVIDSQYNLESNCSQKKKKNKKKPKINPNTKIDDQGETSVMDDSTRINSCHESVVGAGTRTNFEIATTSELSQSQKKGKRKRKRKKQKHSATDIIDKAEVPLANPDLKKAGDVLISTKQSDSPTCLSTGLMEKHDNSGEYGIHESVVDTNTKTDLEIATINDDYTGTNSCHESKVDADTRTGAPVSELSRSRKKRNRKKQKCSSTAFHDKAYVPVAEPDSTKVEENTLISGKQGEFPASLSASLMKKHDDNGELKVATMNDDSTGTNSCHESIVDAVTGANLKIALHPELSRSKRKRHRKKQKCRTTGISNEAHVPVAELDLKKVKETASISEKQCDSPTSPCTSLTKKQNDSGDAGLLESVVDVNTKTDLEKTPTTELGLSQKKRKGRKKKKITAIVIDDEPEVPLAVLDSTKVGEMDLISEEVSGCPRGPSSNLMNKLDNNGGAGFVLVDKENIKTHQMKEDARTYRERRHFSDSEENVKSIDVTRQTSSDKNEMHSFELSDNELQRVEAGEQNAPVKIVENVFNENVSSNCSNGYLGLVESKNTNETKKADSHFPSKMDVLAQVCHSLLEGPHGGCSNKKLLILDVNGLLADIVPYSHGRWKPDIVISRKAVFKRPFCDGFLQFCFEKFNVGVWSSRTKKNVDMVIDFLMGDSRHKLKFCWHQSHCTNTGFTTVENMNKPLVLKELKKLWEKYEPDLPWSKGEYNESNTLLLDDSPYKALNNPAHTAIFPHSYRYKDDRDSSLGPGGDLRVYLERVAEAENVQEFVAQNPFGQRAITEANPSWGFYQRILNSFSQKIQNGASSSGTKQEQ